MRPKKENPMTGAERKTSLHVIQVITRILYSLSTPGERRFRNILARIAVRMSTAAGLRDLIAEVQNLYDQYFGKEDPQAEELEQIEEELEYEGAAPASSNKITETVSKNELKNVLRVLKIKQETCPDDPIVLDLEKYEQELNAEIQAAYVRAQKATTNSTILPYRILEFYDFYDTKIIQAAPAGHKAILEVAAPTGRDTQIQISYYSKSTQVVYTILPTLKLSCIPL